MSLDVIVIGGGPGGAWTAYEAARRGARVAVVDPSAGREKPCGGGVTSRALALVCEVLPPGSLPAIDVRTARIIDTARGRTVTVSLDRGDGQPLLSVLTRAEFDRRLLAAAVGAGANHLEARAVDIRPAHTAAGRLPRWEVQLSNGALLDAPWVIGADGANSLTRRRVGSAFTRAQLSAATGYYLHGATSTEVVLELAADPAGYLWSFPRPDHLAVGICAQADAGATVDALQRRVNAWIDRAGLGTGTAVRRQRYAWPIPSLSASDFDTLDLGRSGVLLVGDAAGLVDPITREGIFFALQAGAYAAAALTSPDPLRTYRALLLQDVVPELRRAAALKAVFFRPDFLDLTRHAIADSAGVRAVLCDLIAGTQSYRGLERRLLGTCEVGLAWRLLRSLGVRAWAGRTTASA